MKLYLHDIELTCDLQIMHYTSPVKYKCIDKHGNILYYPIDVLEKFMSKGSYELIKEAEDE